MFNDTNTKNIFIEINETLDNTLRTKDFRYKDANVPRRIHRRRHRYR